MASLDDFHLVVDSRLPSNAAFVIDDVQVLWDFDIDNGIFFSKVRMGQVKVLPSGAPFTTVPLAAGGKGGESHGELPEEVPDQGHRE